MDIPAPFLFYEGRKKILMKRGIGDPFETKALSGRTTSLLPPSLRCVSEWILLEKLRWKMDEFGTPGAAATRGNIRSRGRGELSCVTSLVTVQFTFLPRSTRREFYFPDRYICRRMHSDLSRRDLSRWNFLRGLLVKIFNFNRFLWPRIFTLLLNFFVFFFVGLYWILEIIIILKAIIQHLSYYLTRCRFLPWVGKRILSLLKNL